MLHTLIKQWGSIWRIYRVNNNFDGLVWSLVRWVLYTIALIPMHIRPCRSFTVALSDCSSINNNVASIIFSKKFKYNWLILYAKSDEITCNLDGIDYKKIVLFSCYCNLHLQLEMRGRTFHNLEISHWYEFPS